MTNFDADILCELRDLQEVAIRTEKHPNTAVVIWVAVADEEVFVRSVRGTKGRWYRDLAAGGPATLEFAGRQLAVQAIAVSDPTAVARASAEVPAEPLCAGDGEARSPADHAPPGTALLGLGARHSVARLFMLFRTARVPRAHEAHMNAPA
jgi:hypothetical protein